MRGTTCACYMMEEAQHGINVSEAKFTDIRTEWKTRHEWVRKEWQDYQKELVPFLQSWIWCMARRRKVLLLCDNGFNEVTKSMRGLLGIISEFREQFTKALPKMVQTELTDLESTVTPSHASSATTCPVFAMTNFIHFKCSWSEHSNNQLLVPK